MYRETLAFMKELRTRLFLSCKRATELIEKRSVVGLTPVERFRLKLHTSMCYACEAYANQSVILRKAMHKWFTEKEKIEKIKLPEPFKKTIIKEIKTLNAILK